MTPTHPTSAVRQCARCGSTESLAPYDYHAYCAVTSHVDLPRRWKEVPRLWQGRSIYHGLIQYSAPVCDACVRRERRRRAGLLAAAVALLAGLAALLWLGHRRYMADFHAARLRFEALEMSDHPEELLPELEDAGDAARRAALLVEEQGRLQQAKDKARTMAAPLGWAARLAVLATAALAVWGLRELRPENVGRGIAVACVRPALRRQGLKYVRRGHLAGGRVLPTDDPP